MLDYDRGHREYNLTVVVSDGHFAVNDTLTVHVTDVNEPPTFRNLSREVNVSENYAGGQLFTVDVTDDDVGDVVLVGMVATPSSQALQFVPLSGSCVRFIAAKHAGLIVISFPSQFVIEYSHD